MDLLQTDQAQNTIKQYNPIADLDGQAIAEYIILNWKSIVNSLDVKASSKRIYRSQISNFIEWLSQRDAVDINTVRNFKADVMGLRTIKAKTKAYRIAAVKVLFKELYVRYRILPVDLGKGVKLPKYSKGHVKDGLSAEQVQCIKQRIAGMDTDKRLRIDAMFHLLAYQALRQKEVATIQIENIDLQSGIIRVDGKTGADQVIYLIPATIDAIRRYMDHFAIKSGYLFFNQSNSVQDGTHISPRSVRRIFKTLFAECDIDKTVHGFRHYCITYLLDKGFAMDEVMRYARITDVNTIKHYNDRRNDKQTVDRIAKAFI